MLRSAAFGIALIALVPAAEAADALETVRAFYVPSIWNPLEGGIEATTGPALAVLEKNEAQTEAACIDFVPTVGGQDYDDAAIGKTLKLQDTGRGTSGATEISATFQLFDEKQEILWTMVEEAGDWKVADIASSEWRLSEIPCE
jgi:hypothetical protein